MVVASPFSDSVMLAKQVTGGLESFAKQVDRLAATAVADPSPFAHEIPAAEQIRLDIEPIETPHVFGFLHTHKQHRQVLRQFVLFGLKLSHQKPPPFLQSEQFESEVVSRDQMVNIFRIK